MEPQKIFRTVFLALAASALFIACDSRNNKTDAEQNEENKVGKIYDAEQQGPGHETRDNQFPESRNDNEKGEGLETGAPTDTANAEVKTPKQ